MSPIVETVLVNPETIDAVTSGVVQIMAAISRPESTATLALTALVVLLVRREK